MDLSPEEEKRARGNMANLTSLVIEVLVFKEKKIGNNPFVAYAENFKAIISKANAKMAALHTLFLELFNANRSSILSSDSNPMWLTTRSVDVHFGKGGKWHKKNYILKISAAAFKASKIREEVDREIKERQDKGTENPNESEALRVKYSYMFTELLHHYLLEVIADALGDAHQDCKAVKKLSLHFRESSHLRPKEKDSVSDEEDIGHKLAKVTKSGIGGKGINDVFSTMTTEGGMLDGIVNMMTKVQETPKTGDKKADMVNILSDLIPDMAETMEGITSMLSNKDQEGDSSSD